MRSYLPNSLSKEVDRRALLEQRQNMQERISKRKGYSSRDVFQVGDRVRIKSNTDGRWETKGVIKEARSSGSSSAPASFLVLCDSGSEIIRHKSYIKHDYTDLDVDFEGLASGLSAGVGSQSLADGPAQSPSIHWVIQGQQNWTARFQGVIQTLWSGFGRGDFGPEQRARTSPLSLS